MSENIPWAKCAIETCAARAICEDTLCFYHKPPEGAWFINSKESEEKYGKSPIFPEMLADARRLKALTEAATKTTNEISHGDDPATITKMLNGRENIYGDFLDMAETCQDLKAVFCKRIEGKEEKFAPDQIETIEMIFLKISRIINGDPDYKDSWVDIAGYAQLIVNRLEKEETNV